LPGKRVPGSWLRHMSTGLWPTRRRRAHSENTALAVVEQWLDVFGASVCLVMTVAAGEHIGGHCRGWHRQLHFPSHRLQGPVPAGPFLH